MQSATGQPGNRWVALGVIWSSSLMVFLARFAVGPLAPFLKEAFSLSNAQIGSLVSASVLTYAPTMIVAGWLVDRVGVRRMLITGTLIIALCVLAVFFAPSYTVMFVTLVVSGLGSGCIFPSSVKAVVLWFSRAERATALGLTQTAVNVAGIAGAAVLPTVAIALGWRYGFLFIGLTGLAICLSCAALYGNPPREVLLPVADSPGGSTPALSATQSMLKLFQSRDIWILGLSGLFISVVEYSLLTHLVLFLKENLYYSAVAAGGLLAMTQAVGAVGKPVSGFASDRLLGGHRKPVILALAGVSALMCLVLAVNQSPGWLLYPVLALLGVGAAGWGGLYATLAGEMGGRELAGMAAGVSAAILVMGAIVGPPLFGYIVDRWGSYQMAWLVMALFAAISVVFVAMIREHKKRI